MVDKYGLRSIQNNTVYQGEICGPGICENKMGLANNEVFLFYALEIVSGKAEYCNILTLSKLPAPIVPTLLAGDEFNMSMDQLLEMADALDYDNGKPAEGIVVRDMAGKISFKVVSRRFLVKYKE
jgi:hypothetical protein